MELNHLKGRRVNRFFEVLHLFLQVVEPSAIQFFIDLMYEEGSQSQLKISFGPFELGGVVHKGIFNGGFHAFDFLFKQILVFFGSFVKLVCKLNIVIHDCALQAINLGCSLLRKLLILSN